MTVILFRGSNSIVELISEISSTSVRQLWLKLLPVKNWHYWFSMNDIPQKDILSLCIKKKINYFLHRCKCEAVRIVLQVLKNKKNDPSLLFTKWCFYRWKINCNRKYFVRLSMFTCVAYPLSLATYGNRYFRLRFSKYLSVLWGTALKQTSKSRVDRFI